MSRVVVIGWSLALLVAFGWPHAAGSARQPRIRVTPSASLEDQRVIVRVDALAPRQPVSINLRSTDAKGFVWVSTASFLADARGDLDLSRAPSRGGSYAGVWSMGLLASMRSTKPDPYGSYFWPRSGANVFTITLQTHGRVIASTRFRRSWTRQPLSEQDTTVASAGFVGTFFSPTGAKRRTTVLVVGGSEGGLHTRLLASRFAARGFPALAIAYFDAPGLPQTLTNIPLEYFRGALAWLAKQPQVDPGRIVVLGISRGSEVALLLGVHDADLVHGVVALVPSSVVNCGIQGGLGGRAGCTGAAWTIGGKPLPYTEQFNNPVPTDVPAAVIPVEQIKAPVLLACGGLDETWHSCQFAQSIISRLKASHDDNPHVTYAYLDAGHAVGVLLPYEPGTSQYDLNIPFDEQAREQLWPHVLSFLTRIR